MNYELILSDELLLVSDELIKEGDTIISQYDNNGDYCIQVMKYTDSTYCKEPMKLLGGTPSLPKITFSEEAYKEMKERFGWVDVEMEVGKELGGGYSNYDLIKAAWIAGFKLCQSLNKNRFSEEDMESAFNAAQETINHHGDLKYLCFSDYKEQLRQPKRVKVEFETLPNEIKITKLC